MIPIQLKHMRFNRVLFKEKRAFESGWQNNPYSYEEIQKYFPKENYGVMCGSELRVLDDDTPDKKIIDMFLENFGETFRVRDHLYFKFDNGESKKIIFQDGKEHLGECQGEGTYVVGPGSIHPSGEVYEQKNDLEIKTISYEKFKEVFGKYLTSQTTTQTQEHKINFDDDDFVKSVKDAWTEGNRQDLAMSLAGYLRKEKRLGLNSALAIVENVCHDCQDNEVSMRLNAVRSTYNKDESEIKGYSGLVEKNVLVSGPKVGYFLIYKEDFIWDENQVLQTKYFPTDIISDKLSFGFLMPKIIDDVDKNGNVTGKKQITRPSLIMSGEKLIVINKRFKEDHNLDFRNIPLSLPRRWRLEDMKKYLDDKSEIISGENLLSKIVDKYKHYLFIRDETWYKVHALWDIGTYLHMGFSAYPFIELRGIAGTGKTKAMTISSMISFNGSEIMVNPSESTLFREKEDMRGTTYFDEAEKLWVYNKATKQYEGDTRTELINSSYSKAGKVPRQEKIGNKFFTKWYSPYGPTQLGSINGLYGATEQRAITRITTKSPNNDNRGEKEPEDDRNNSIWAEIRNDCYVFTLENFKKIMEIYHNFPKDVGLKRRDLQLWRPLLSISKFISEELYQEILEFAIKISQRNLDDLIPESSFDYAVLKALKYCVESNSGKIYVSTIKEMYCQLENKFDSREDKYLNRNISNHLDKLGLKELRSRDNRASYFDINLSTFNEIVGPISPNLVILSTSSTSSTLSNINNSNNSVDDVVISGDEEKEKVVMVAISGESVDDNELDTSKKDIPLCPKCNAPIVNNKCLGGCNDE